MIWRRRDRERDMQEELRSLRELQERPGELGNLTLAAENARAEFGWQWLECLLQDTRYTLRQLRANPAFAAVVILTLAAASAQTPRSLRRSTRCSGRHCRSATPSSCGN
jgi:hypothetical protein